MVLYFDKRSRSSYSLLLLSVHPRFMVSNTSQQEIMEMMTAVPTKQQCRQACNKLKSKETRKQNIPDTTTNMEQVSSNYSFKYLCNF